MNTALCNYFERIALCIYEVMGCKELFQIMKNVEGIKMLVFHGQNTINPDQMKLSAFLDLSELFEELDKPVRRREFKL